MAADNGIRDAYLLREDGQSELLQLQANGNPFGAYITFVQTNLDERSSVLINAWDHGDNNGIRCQSAGLVVGCEATDSTSPWHNFASNTDQWHSKDGKDLCSNDGAAFMPLVTWTKSLANGEAHHLWVDGNAEVALIGSPWAADVSCTIVVDNYLNGVTLVKEQENITLDIEDVSMPSWNAKKVSFHSSPGEKASLLMNAGDSWDNRDDYCYVAVLVVSCVATDASSPWNNFHSNVQNWQSEDGKQLCSNNGAALFTHNIAWINELLDNGANHIWVEGNKEVNLIGSPWTNGTVGICELQENEPNFKQKSNFKKA